MKFSIRDKLIIGFAVIILLMIVGNAYVLLELRAVSSAAKDALTTDARIVTIAEQLQEALDNEEQYTQRYLTTKDSAYLTVGGHNGLAFTFLIDSLSTLAGERPLLRRPLREIDRTHVWLLTNVTESNGVLAVADNTRTIRSRGEAFVYIRATLNQVFNYARYIITTSVAGSEQKTMDSYALALLLTGGTLLVAVMLAFAITRTITRPLNLLMKGTQEIARGSFAHISVSSSDETALLAEAFNRMSDRLSEINTYKADMMQQISHEIRSPLQLMLLSYYILTERTSHLLSDKHKEVLDSIRRNIDKITRFADDFLDLSRIEAGQMEFHFTSVDLTTVVQRAVNDASILANPRHIDIEMKREEIPLLVADGDKCSQVINNLLNNAVKFSNDGGSVTVTLRPNRTGVCIDVQDCGMGIAPDEIGMLFTKFFRTSTSIKGKIKGTGLGLALVKAIVDGHGGTIGVTSELGKGSTFTVEFLRVPPVPGYDAGKGTQNH